jgi:tRNA (mo5U34)-methyltransferase
VGVDSDALFGGVYWHQRWQVFKDVFTPGRNPVEELCELIDLPTDLRGKRVLDIGAWNGCFSFECERRGADEVVALTLERAEDTGFDRLREAIGSRVVRYVQDSIYTASPDTPGTFDVVLFFGVLYHLRYPLLAVDRIRNLCEGECFVETHVLDESFVDPDGNTAKLTDIDPRLENVSVWQFYKGDERQGDHSNWFAPNIQAVLAAFESAGFAIELKNTWTSRAAFVASTERTLGASFSKTYEGVSQPKLDFVGAREGKPIHHLSQHRRSALDDL